MTAASAVNRVVAAWSCRTSDGGVRLPSDSAGVRVHEKRESRYAHARARRRLGIVSRVSFARAAPPYDGYKKDVLLTNISAAPILASRYLPKEVPLKKQHVIVRPTERAYQRPSYLRRPVSERLPNERVHSGSGNRHNSHSAGECTRSKSWKARAGGEGTKVRRGRRLCTGEHPSGSLERE